MLINTMPENKPNSLQKKHNFHQGRQQRQQQSQQQRQQQHQQQGRQQHKPTHPVTLLAWCSVTVLLMALLFAGYFYTRMHYLLATLHPLRTPVSSGDMAAARVELGAYSDVAFVTSDGLTLRGWYHPSRTGAVVIFVHGGGHNRTESLRVAGALAKQGIGSLLYDSRANGQSDGKLQGWGDKEQADLTAALDFVGRQPDVNPARIGVQGFSIGASTAVLVAAHDSRVHAVLLNVVWPSLYDELAYKASQPKWLTLPLLRWIFESAGIELNRVRPMDAIHAIAPRPLMMLVGDQDEDTPLRISQSMFALAGEPKQFSIVRGAGHGNYLLYGGDAYVASIVQFFATNLR